MESLEPAKTYHERRDAKVRADEAGRQAQELRARIAELQAEQIQCQSEATARLTAYSAVIGELQRWLAQAEAPSASHPPTAPAGSLD